MSSQKACECAFCSNRLPFSFPEHLVNELLAGNIVLFSGAGISTENKSYAQHTFYEQVAHELGCGNSKSFPELMEEYCRQPNGRIRLVTAIKDRFDYFCSFDDFYRDMTQFHRALSPLYMIREIVTTNWDDFFEKECGFDSFVGESDMAFWAAAKRRLMKIHGSIRNLGSLVATVTDYDTSTRRLNDGPMGAQLKVLLTQKTFIYTGYSLSDSTFLNLAEQIAAMMSPNLRQSYFVSPFIDHDKIKSFPIPLAPIQTDGSFFFEQLRIHVQERAAIVSEDAFDACDELLNDACDAHIRAADMFIKTKHPLLVFAMSYQDGLIHGLKRVKRLRSTGEYHSRAAVARKIAGYEQRAGEFRRKRDYWNSSYADGYSDALLMLLIFSDDLRGAKPPLYGHHKDVQFASLSALLRFPKTRVSAAYKAQAERIIARVGGRSGDLIPDHTPYL